MADFVHAAVLEQHFHNVEADLHGWVLQPVQVVERGTREPLAPFPVHRRRRPRPLLRRAGLDLNKHKAILVSADEVNLAAWRAEVRGKKLQPIAFEVPSGGALSQFPMLEVERFLDPAQPGPDACRKVHAMPEQDFFDCSPTSFYNSGVPKTNDLSAPVSRNCPVCAGNDALSHLQKGELHLVRCKTCGTRLWHEPLTSPVLVFIAAGTLDHSDWAVPSSHIWTGRCAPFHDIDFERI